MDYNDQRMFKISIVGCNKTDALDKIIPTAIFLTYEPWKNKH